MPKKTARRPLCAGPRPALPNHPTVPAISGTTSAIVTIIIRSYADECALSRAYLSVVQNVGFDYRPPRAHNMHAADCDDDDVMI